MSSFKDWLQLFEGVYDPYILKAVFLAGGPGSGKSFVVKSMFEGKGLQFVASDRIFEIGMKRAGLDFKAVDDTIPSYGNLRQKAIGLTDKRLSQWAKQVLGLVIDGTGHDFTGIRATSDGLRYNGYDTYMVFVNTALEVALERNARRSRTLPEDVVIDKWQRVQKNIGKFQRYFGSDRFYIIDNSEDLDSQGLVEFQLRLSRIAMDLLKKPLRNPIGLELMHSLAGDAPQFIHKPPNTQHQHYIRHYKEPRIA